MQGESDMDNWTFGITMIVVGMGGTIAALGGFALLMGLLKRVFPYREAGPPSNTPRDKAAP